MLLDTGETLFVWIGLDSNKAEKDAVLMTAKDYLMSDPSERNIDIPIIVVKQSFEPPHFTGYFGAWDAELFPAVSYLIWWIFFDFGYDFLLAFGFWSFFLCKMKLKNQHLISREKGKENWSMSNFPIVFLSLPIQSNMYLYCLEVWKMTLQLLFSE